MDRLKFLEACAAADNGPGMNGIGTLAQKTLHAVLKLYFEPDISRHEVKIAGSIADIVSGSDIIEIQTGNFDKLRPKLDKFLPEHRVTIVYPAPHTRWLCWVNPETGEVTKKTKSPKTGGISAVFCELYRILPYLLARNLRLCIVLVDLVEYRNLDGWSRDKKKGGSKNERIPVDLYDEIYIDSPMDYMKLVPEALGDSFTAKEFAKAAGLSPRDINCAIQTLLYIGVIRRAGYQGNSYLYERSLDS
jgi:hypothetical protein